MSLYCHECGSSSLRQAHFRLADTLHLLAFKYPVRCRACRRRWYASMMVVRRLPHAPHRRQDAEKVS